MRHFLTFFFILLLVNCRADFSDDFSDGNFTANPTWNGTIADYIVNTSQELQLNNSVAGTSYLSTAHNLATIDNKEWRIWTKQSFASSGSNYGRIYLTSNSADLSSDPEGYYIQLGEAGSNDAIRLFKNIGGIHTELLSGVAAQIATSFTIGIKVFRDNLGNWSLFVDETGGENYTLVGSVNDASSAMGTHFGFLDVYTASNATKFYYDNIYIGDEILDTSPPVLLSATAINASLIDVLFDEALNQLSAENTSNYDIQPFVIIQSASLDGTNPALVHLIPVSPLSNGGMYSLITTNIADTALNISGVQAVNFMYVVPDPVLPGDVIINEFFCDPSPVIGLPEAEFVEIYNKSSKVFDVSGWEISDGSSTGTLQSAYLLPGNYLVLTSTSNVGLYSPSVGVSSFPSLNNSGDNIVLMDNTSVVLDDISYTDSWYNDPEKIEGGYTIERINPNDPCTDIQDWGASLDVNGGTPGTQNSVYDNTPDINPPGIDQILAFSPNYITIQFNEGMDSTLLADAIISSTPSLTVQSLNINGAFPTEMQVYFNETISTSTLYEIALNGIGDCWLNTTDLTGNFALPEPAVSGDIVINEIMFDPLTGGYDWVEVYNNSDKLIDLIGWEIANYNDSIANKKKIEFHYLLQADSYVVFTEDSNQIIQNYPAYTTGTFLQMDLPSFNSDSSTVYLLIGDTIIDKVSYNVDWHFKLLDNTDGKSLERINPDGNSDDFHNWHTAAEAIGFATPGKINSQFREILSEGSFTIENDVISPDNDGFEDVLLMSYELPDGEFVGNCTVYDDRGRMLIQLKNSELLATSDSFSWDGVKEDQTKATIGTYIVVFEAVNIDNGEIFSARKAFVLAGKL